MQDPAPKTRPIGEAHGVVFEVAAWDGVGADVDLSCACMFEGEAGGQPPRGGLLHLDTVLKGALTDLRRHGDFAARELETLLLTMLPGEVQARAVLVIGMGDLTTLTSARIGRAAAAGLREAVRRGARSAAFAPSLLDSGVSAGSTPDAPQAMLQGVLQALVAERRLAELGLAPAPALTRWVFDAGAAHLDAVAAGFLAAFPKT